MHRQRWRFILGIWQHRDSIGLRLTRFDKAQSEKAQTLREKKTHKKNARCVPRGHFDSLCPPASSLHALLSPH